MLKEQGIDCARRTVAKYREAMRIPSSAERRRLGRLGMARSVPSLPVKMPSAALAAQALHQVAENQTSVGRKPSRGVCSVGNGGSEWTTL